MRLALTARVSAAALAPPAASARRLSLGFVGGGSQSRHLEARTIRAPHWNIAPKIYYEKYTM